jgi:hypothetical protein
MSILSMAHGVGWGLVVHPMGLADSHEFLSFPRADLVVLLCAWRMSGKSQTMSSFEGGMYKVYRVEYRYALCKQRSPGPWHELLSKVPR